MLNLSALIPGEHLSHKPKDELQLLGAFFFLKISNSPNFYTSWKNMFKPLWLSVIRTLKKALEL